MDDNFSKAGLFRDLDDDLLKELARSATTVETHAGDEVVSRGEQADSLFVVDEGEFEVYLLDPVLSVEKVIKTLGPRAAFGEIAVFTGGVRTASVRSLGPGRLLRLHRDAVVAAVERYPAMGLAFCRVLASYVDEITAREPLVRYGSLSEYPDAAGLQGHLPERIAQVCRAVVLDVTGDRIVLGVLDPLDSAGLHFLREAILPRRPSFVMLPEREIDSVLESGAPRVDDLDKETPALDAWRILGGGDEWSLEDTVVDRFLASCFWWGVRLQGSDLHLEPKRDRLQARLRVDGKLVSHPGELEPAAGVRAVTRLKVLAGLDTTKRRIPQNGSFRLLRDETQFDLRLSILPTEEGEKAALRFIPVQGEHGRIRSLVEGPAVALEIQSLFEQPSGLVLVSGPTGAGKTTTLYAGLQAAWDHEPTRNIVTVEDPIDKRLDFATQVAVQPGGEMSLGRILRAVLRQDPDVILVGEIRDRESADLALEAGTTGHLVLSSLHSHFALEAVIRLRSLDVPSYLIASGLLAVVAQRLVPRVCPSCAEESEAVPAELDTLQRLGVLDGDSLTVSRGRGCAGCRDEGTRGRVALFEVLSVTPGLREGIHDGLSVAELEREAAPGALRPMAAYARFLLEQGLVAPEDVIRAFPGVPAA